MTPLADVVANCGTRLKHERCDIAAKEMGCRREPDWTRANDDHRQIRTHHAGTLCFKDVSGAAVTLHAAGLP